MTDTDDTDRETVTQKDTESHIWRCKLMDREWKGGRERQKDGKIGTETEKREDN